MLHIKVPLLNIGPYGFRRNGIHTKRKLSLSLASSAVADDVVSLCGVRQRRRVLQGLCIAFVSIGVFVENAVAATDGSLAISPRVISKADARRSIEKMTLHAADRYPRCHSALNDSIWQVGNRWGPPVLGQKIHAAV